MYGFNGFDIDGNSYFVDEQGNNIGIVHSSWGIIQAVRLDSSVYMGTDGKVYADTQNKCIKYTTNEWFNWARRKMISLGFRPSF